MDERSEGSVEVSWKIIYYMILYDTILYDTIQYNPILSYPILSSPIVYYMSLQENSPRMRPESYHTRLWHLNHISDTVLGDNDLNAGGGGWNRREDNSSTYSAKE